MVSPGFRGHHTQLMSRSCAWYPPNPRSCVWCPPNPGVDAAKARMEAEQLLRSRCSASTMLRRITQTGVLNPFLDCAALEKAVKTTHTKMRRAFISSKIRWENLRPEKSQVVRYMIGQSDWGRAAVASSSLEPKG